MSHRYLVPQLFREITLHFTANCLPVLDEWIETREKDKLEAVAYLLKGDTAGLCVHADDLRGEAAGGCRDHRR